MKKSIKKVFYYSVISLCLVLVGLIANLYYTQEDRIFEHKQIALDYDFKWDLPHKEVWLKANDNATLHAIHCRSTRPNGEVILYFHGKGSNLSHPKWLKKAHQLTARGCDVFLVDYRGFGKSRGQMSHQAILNDALLAFDHLNKEYDHKKITCYGWSLGTGIATYVAANRNPKQLILEAPFYNLFDIACTTAQHIPPAVISFVMRYPFPTDEWIESVHCPVTIFHGTKDKIIPVDSSMRLIKHIPVSTQSELVVIEGGNHRNLHYMSEFNRKLDALLRTQKD